MSSFLNIFNDHSWEDVGQTIYQTSEKDVARILSNNRFQDWSDFVALISPAAKPFIPQMAEISKQITARNFGKTIQLYAPMYVSNECQNICTYCGFSLDNKIDRKVLSDEELHLEFQYLKNEGFNHILIVAGEANKKVGAAYFNNVIRIANQYFANVSLEVQPLHTDEYKQLKQNGLFATLVYQETYHQDNYKIYHPKGKKSNFKYRIETPDRLGSVGIHKMGLGVLLGLEDWRIDSAFCALHLDYLQRKYWQTKYSISFPRLRPAVGCSAPNVITTEQDLIQLIAAYRLFFPELDISISTRETAKFRDSIIGYGPTTMSAASKTNPGGYVVSPQELEQFEIDDSRSLQEFEQTIVNRGFTPVYKDWDSLLLTLA